MIYAELNRDQFQKPGFHKALTSRHRFQTNSDSFLKTMIQEYMGTGLELPHPQDFLP